MASLLWGKVYYNELFAGYIKEEVGGDVSFTYDDSYLNTGSPPIAHTLPLSSATYISRSGLHPFFDNLVAEGWLEEAQTRLLGKRIASRFELLLAFGQDLAGAVSVIDPESSTLSKLMLDMSDPKELAIMSSRASLSGVQPKLTLVKKDTLFLPAKVGETSTYIAKFPSNHHSDLVINEYLTMLAFKALLPDDKIADVRMGEINGFSEQALIIKRFDRTDEGSRIHFEEFNQLLGLKSKEKYGGAYKEMADFIYNTNGCTPVETYKLYLRVLAGLIIGNTDMHFKNFAMFHTSSGLRLTPSYDQVAAAIYQYKTVALKINGAPNLQITILKPANIIKLGEEFGLNSSAIKMATEYLEKNIEAGKQAISEAELGTDDFKNQLINMMEKRWNGTFSLIGKKLSSKQ